MAQVTVKESGGNYGTLKLAIDAAETDISIEGKFNDLPHETGAITWDTAGVSVVCDSDAQYKPNSPRTGGSYHHALHCSSGSHCITMSSAGSLQGIEVKQTSGTTSAECIRVINSGTTTNLKKLLVWTGNSIADQDGIYSYHSNNGTINIENCIIVDCYRAGVDWQKYSADSGNHTIINVNSCTIYYCGAEGDDSCGGVVTWCGNYTDDSDGVVYVYNSIVCDSPYYDFDFETYGDDSTGVVDRCLYTSAGNIDTETDSTSSVEIKDGSIAASGEILVEDDDTTPYDLRLAATDSNCEAWDAHSDGSGPNSMSIPTTDIMGTTRSAPYCVGAFEKEAIGDLSINTSQSINVTESVLAELIADLTVDLYEQLNLSEYVLPSMNLGGISIDETLELAESLTSGVPILPSRFDQITLTEFLQLLASIAPNKFEQITIAEFVSLLKDIGIREFENITVNEAILASIESTGIDLYEAIELSEFISILKDIGIDTAQQITISEVINGVVTLAGISVNESITINEAITGILSIAGIDTAQSIEVSEFVSGILSVAGINVSQDITLAEYVNLLTTSDLPITDAYEQITISESIELLFSYLPVSEIQNIELSEFVNLLLTTAGINTSQNIDLSEAVQLLMSLATISASDSISLSEAVTALIETTGANVYELISINEYIQAILGLTGVSVSESVTVSEFIIVTMVAVAGLMRVNFQIKRPKITFNAY